MEDELAVTNQNNGKVLAENPGGNLIPIQFPPPGHAKGKTKKRKPNATTPGLQLARPINGEGEVFNLNVDVREA